MKLSKKKKGFTLIELMAVIAIVAILAAVLVPTVNGYITRAKKTAVITQCRMVMNAIESYDASNGNSGSVVTTPGDKLSESVGEGKQLQVLIDEGLLDNTKLSNIQDATITQIETINANETGDIINKIQITSGNFSGLR